MRFTFNKSEKLKSKKLIELLFTEGKSVSAYPVKLMYHKIEHTGEFLLQTGFSVPKRRVKLAARRNRIKRLLRECYRKQKHSLYDKLDEKYIFMFIYLDENEQKYVLLEDKMAILFKKFLNKVQ